MKYLFIILIFFYGNSFRIDCNNHSNNIVINSKSDFKLTFPNDLELLKSSENPMKIFNLFTTSNISAKSEPSDISKFNNEINNINNNIPNKNTMYIFAILLLSFVAIILLIILFLKYKRLNDANLILINEADDRNNELNALIDDKEELLNRNKRIIEDLNNYRVELEYQNKELANSEYNLLIQKNKYAELFNSAPVAYFLLDANYSIITSNLKANEIFCQSTNELTGKYFHSFFSGNSKDLFHFFKDNISDTDTIQKEIYLETPNETIATIMEFKLFYDESLKSNVIFVAVIDINDEKLLEDELNTLNQNLQKAVEERTSSLTNALEEKKKTETELREKEEFISNFTQKLPLGIYRTTAEGKIIFANNKLMEIMGFKSYNEFKNNYVDDFFVDKNSRKDLIERLKQGETTFEFNLLRKDGKEIIVRDTGSLEFDKDNNILYLDGIIEDITDEKNAEMKLQNAFNQLKETKNMLEEANQLKGIILGNLGHELRTPLNGILGFTQLLLEEITDEDHKEMMNMIYDSASRLHKTLNSLLSITELEANFTSLNMTDIELDFLINNVINQFYSIIDKKSIEVKIIQDMNNPLVYGDEFLLTQVFFNILDNSVKFTNEGFIRINISERADTPNYIILTIEDSGIGISEAKLSNIFDAFRQESEGYDRKFEGVGIGLTITKKIADMLHCHIEVKSKINVGTKTTIYIPKNESVIKLKNN